MSCDFDNTSKSGLVPDPNLNLERTILDSKIRGLETDLRAAGVTVHCSDISAHLHIGPIIGKGGFAKVYLCTDSKGNQYAAKHLNLQRDTDFRAVMHEVTALHMMAGNPYVVQLDSVYFTPSNELYIVMEYMKDGSFEDFRKKNPGLSQRVIQYIMCEVVKAFFGIHKLGIIHRDIKNGNILIRVEADGKITAKIADFGLCWIPSISGNCNSFAGTLFYMSPEASNSGRFRKNYGQPTDMWSLGVLIARLHSLQLPHLRQTNQTDMQLCLQMYSQNQIPDFEPSAKISADCCKVVNACLRVNPSERPTIDKLMEHPYFNFVP